MDQGELFPLNDLTAILSAGEGNLTKPLPAADPMLEDVMEHGMTDMDESDRPGIHISGSDGRVRVIADPSRDQPRERARLRSRLGPPPQGSPMGPRPDIDPRAAYPATREYMSPPQFAPQPMYAPQPMSMGAQVIVHAVDFQRGMLVTSHGAIPIAPETVSKLMQLSIVTMREFFAESVNATMQAYNLGGKRRAKPKRRKKKV